MKKTISVLFVGLFCLFTISQICRIFFLNNNLSQNQSAATVTSTITKPPALTVLPVLSSSTNPYTTKSTPPVGSFESLTNGVATGWTVDSSNPTVSIYANFYIDGKVGVGGLFVGSSSTTVYRPDIIKKYPKYTGNHGFIFSIPSQYKDGKTHTLYVYGTGGPFGPATLLSGSPKSFKIAAPILAPTNYTIVANVGAGGRVSLPGTITMPFGSVINYTIQPNLGYVVGQVTVDGSVVPAGDLVATANCPSSNCLIYSFKNISANHILGVTFVPIPVSGQNFTITATNGSGGTTLPKAGVQTLPYGYGANYIIQPNGGYQVSQVTVDGAVVTVGGNLVSFAGCTNCMMYSFNNLSANHTLNSTFVIATTSSVVIVPPTVPTQPTTPVQQNNSLTYDVNQPFVPADNISTNNVSSNGVDLQWPDVTGAVGYGVYLNNVLLDTTTDNSYNMEGVLMPDTSYTLNVEALMDMTQVDGSLALAKTGTGNFWTNLWSGLLAAAGVSTQPVNISKTFDTSPALAVPIKGNVKVLAVVFSFIDTNSATLDTPASVNGSLFGDSNSSAAFYKENSFNQLTLGGVVNLGGDVFPQVVKLAGWQPTATFPSPSLGSITSGMASITMPGYVNDSRGHPKSANLPLYESINKQLISGGYNPKNYNIVIYVWPQNNKDYAGVSDSIGLVGGDIKGRIWINGPQNGRVYTHEIGHKLGLHHADSVVCGQSFILNTGEFCNYQNYNPYGDPVNVMGNQSYGEFNQYNKSLLNWIPSVPITQSGRYSLNPVENSQTVALHFPKTNTNDEYYLEYRQKTGFDSTLSDIDVGGISVDILNQHIFKVLGVNGLQDHDATGETFKVNTLTGGYSTGWNLSDGGVFEDPINDLRVIQVSHNQNQASVFVRFDTTQTPAVSAVPATINNLPSAAYTGKVTVSWLAVPAVSGSSVGYELYRDATTTNSLIYDGGNISYVDNVSAGSGHLYYVRAYDSFSELPDKKYYLPFSPATYGGNSFGLMANVIHRPTNPPTFGMDPINAVCNANSTNMNAQSFFYDIANMPQYYVTGKPCSNFNAIEWTESTGIMPEIMQILPNGPKIFADQPGTGTGYSEYFFDPSGNSVSVPTPGGRTYYYFNYQGTGIQIIK